MRIPYYHVDAFAGARYTGNPAGVCLLEAWPADDLLQSIAAENNLAETAFLVPRGEAWDLRWFTPEIEIDLCGHATLASAHVLMVELRRAAGRVRFESRSGPLFADDECGVLVLDFPARPATACPCPDALVRGLRARPREVLRSRDYLAVFDTMDEVAAIAPDFGALGGLDATGIIVTAPGGDTGTDFVSRFFAPAAGIPEDPVTGSAHCTLVPYWAARLGKTRLSARQISRRGGDLACELVSDRVRMGGRTVLHMRGEIVTD